MHVGLLALILVALCIPGVWLMSRFTARELGDRSDAQVSKQTLFTLTFLQTIVIVSLAVAAGIYFGGAIGLTDPFLEGLGRGELNLTNLLQQLGTGIVAGILCATGWVVSYYAFIRPRIDTVSIQISEQVRQQLGLAARVMSGGINEEIIFRWGMLSLTMWGMLQLTTSETTAFWISILATGLVFGLAHLPGLLAKGCIPSPFLIASTLLGNIWVSIICGYLFWQYGIIAAILVHMLFHIIWYPLELKYKH